VYPSEEDFTENKTIWADVKTAGTGSGTLEKGARVWQKDRYRLVWIADKEDGCAPPIEPFP
jgi:hypothetical protein